MLKMVQNIDMSRGFCRISTVADVEEIPKCWKYFRILICLVNFTEHQIFQLLH